MTPLFKKCVTILKKSGPKKWHKKWPKITVFSRCEKSVNINLVILRVKNRESEKNTCPVSKWGTKKSDKKWQKKWQKMTKFCKKSDNFLQKFGPFLSNSEFLCKKWSKNFTFFSVNFLQIKDLISKISGSVFEILKNLGIFLFWKIFLKKLKIFFKKKKFLKIF